VSSAARSQQFYPKADASVSVASESAFISRAREAADIARRWRSDASKPIPLASGRANLVWAFETDDGEYVLKTPGDGESATDFRLEAAVARYADDHGVPVARALDADSGHVISERLIGRSLKEIDDAGDEAAVLAAIPDMARALAAAHRIAVDGFGLVILGSGETFRGGQPHWARYLLTRLDEHLVLLMNAGFVTAPVVKRVRRALTPLSDLPDPVGRLLHGDCGPQNAIVDEGGTLRLYDWEDAVAGDPLFEVAQWTTFQPERRWAPFFDAYRGETDWRPDLTFWLYHLRITLAKTAVRALLGIADQPGRPTARQRIEESLDRLLAT